ncbi:N-acylneuraminate-9-phosphatase [Sergentomyia squamirostris]
MLRKREEREKLVNYLQEEHGMSPEAALVATSSFLCNFRRCPDNEELPLDEWRCHLWLQALPDPYKCLSETVYRTWLQLRLHYMEPTGDVLKFLESLKSHYLLGLISNGPSAAQWEKVNRLNLAKYFDCILVSGDLPWEKPDPRIYRAACELLGVAEHQCIMIGDKLETDIQGGKEAKLGATFWLPLTSAERVEPDGPMPDFTIHNVVDMMTMLPYGRYTTSRSRCSSIGTTSGAVQRRLRLPYNRRVASLPDLDNCNSNSSDGS